METSSSNFIGNKKAQPTDGLKTTNGMKDAGSLSLEKEKSKLEKINASHKTIRTENKKLLLTKLNSSLPKQALNGVGDKKEAVKSKAKSASTRSTPSSPTSVYSLPATFQRFSNDLKQRNKVKGAEKASSSRLSLLEKAASVLKVTTTGRKSSVVNSISSSVLSIGSGPKALRRSWEGNADTKGKNNSDSKTAKADRKSENKSTTVCNMLTMLWANAPHVFNFKCGHHFLLRMIIAFRASGDFSDARVCISSCLLISFFLHDIMYSKEMQWHYLFPFVPYTNFTPKLLS